MESFTLEQFSYLADVIGMIAVVASLIYVGKQLQLNNQQMRMSAVTSYADFVKEIQIPIALNREFAELWVKGGTELASLDEVDKARLRAFEITAVYHWYHLFGLRQQNLIPDNEWQQITWGFETFGKRQAVRETWKTSRVSFDKPFQDFMGRYLD